MKDIGSLLDILLIVIKLSLASAGVRHVTEYQTYRKFYTSLAPNHSLTYSVRGLLECSSKCNSETELACLGYSFLSRSGGFKDCILYNNLNGTPLSVSASPGAEIVYAIKGAGSSCPDGYYLNPYADTCIRLVRETKSWEDAKTNCESNGEYLLTLASSNSFNWFKSFRLDEDLTAGMSPDWIWVGLNASNFRWRWQGRSTSSLSVTELKWNQVHDEPDSNSDGICGRVSSNEMYDGLFDTPCSSLHASICELV